ncbi:MAG: hypothetical protein ACOCSF_05650, partial [Halanaeroarchaeum sp.]
MKQKTIATTAVLATLLVMASAATASPTLVLGNEHTTDGDFQNGTLEDVVVDGSGESAHVQLPDSTVVDGFEDGDLSEWNTSDKNGTYTTTSDPSKFGNHSFQIDPADSAEFVNSTSGLNYYPQQGDTIKFDYRHSVENGKMAFVFAQNDSSYYVVGYDSSFFAQDSFYIHKVVEGDYIEKYESTGYDPPSDEWIDVSIDWNVGDDKIEPTISSSAGTKTISITDTQLDGDQIAIGSFGDARHWYDNIRVNGSRQGTYTSAAHSVTDPEEGRVDFPALSDANATVTWQADPDSNGSWTDVATSTYSS